VNYCGIVHVCYPGGGVTYPECRACATRHECDIVWRSERMVVIEYKDRIQEYTTVAMWI
jgi:hypothetical protein